MKTTILAFGLISLLSGTANASSLNAEIGLLSCDVSAGIGLIIKQSQTLNCTFTTSKGETQKYSGNITEYGIELGEVKEAEMTWTVLAATTTIEPGALQGDYAGVNADASLSVGAGVNLLVGGLDKSFTLQPLSVDTEKGTSLSAGVTTMSLVYNP